jgi:SPP1 family predicted phage head-tail adaptor
LSNVPPAPGGYTPIGAFNRQITLFLPGLRDAGDGSTGPPAAWGTSWAAKRPLQGQEIDKAQQIAQKISGLWVIPYQLGILESMTFTIEGRTFEIAAIDDPDEQHIELHVYAFEVGQNAGQQS